MTLIEIKKCGLKKRRNRYATALIITFFLEICKIFKKSVDSYSCSRTCDTCLKCWVDKSFEGQPDSN